MPELMVGTLIDLAPIRIFRFWGLNGTDPRSGPMTQVLSPPSHSDGFGAPTLTGPITVLPGTFAGTIWKEVLASEIKR